MKQEEKELLLKELCARLPYGVNVEYTFKVTVIATNTEEIRTKSLFLYSINTLDNMTVSGIDDDGYETICFFEEVKPYLFPLSSMTEEQNEELHDKLIELELQALNGEISRIDAVKFEIDYYLKNHIDYCGLIEKGLATDCTNLNIY